MNRSSRRTVLASTIAALLTPLAAWGQLEEIIVTAQKREESAQDVPIAITAFDASALKAKQISTFGDVRFAAPNVGYAKGNFTGNNFQIRGIGTSLVATASDDGVGIHVNEVPILYPRLFETEYYDVQQVAILRGPQGTLYGRNSTGGAVNMITNAADPDEVEANVEGQYGNYEHTKLIGMLNVPLGSKFAVRVAGILLQRDGYTENEYTGDDIDDRDQYSVRGSVRWMPTDTTTIDLMASYFDEDSSRTRSQKQMCHNDPSALLGCLPDRLAFETVNPSAQLTGILGSTGFHPVLGPIFGLFPFNNNVTSPNPDDMRKVYADFAPVYEADETLVTLRMQQEFDQHTLTAIYGYQDTSVLSQLDYNANVGQTVSLPAAFVASFPVTNSLLFQGGLLPLSAPSANGTGSTGLHVADHINRIDGYDQSNQDTDQDSIEVHVNSNYDGAFNWLGGLFYMQADSFNQYWVLSSGLDYISALVGSFLGGDGHGWVAPQFLNHTDNYGLETKAAFGEAYFQINDEIKLTLGARYTIDQKEIKDYQLLLNSTATGSRIFQEIGADLPIPVSIRDTDDEWKEWTGRAVLDWAPEVSFTDATLLYFSYSRGYKGGGFNPPFDPVAFPDTSATFEPEFVDAFEVGSKNQLIDNTLQANLTAFYYDYQGLQVSKIINRTSFNENADAVIYGLEAEFLLAPDEHWQLSANFAYLHTEVQDFSTVDTRDPSQGRSDVTLIKDLGNASNCVALMTPAAFAPRSQFNSCATLRSQGLPIVDGIEVDLDGNQLQNSPEFTVSLGAQYTFDLVGGYELATRLDYYWQDEMYGRIFNRDPIDTIDSWDIWNAQATLLAPDERWFARAYVKNIEDDDNVVSMYVSDPSSGLFTNVFTIEPRTYGLAVGYNF